MYMIECCGREISQIYATAVATDNLWNLETVVTKSKIKFIRSFMWIKLNFGRFM